MKTTFALALVILSMAFGSVAIAQDSCTDENKAALELCISTAKATCDAAYPQCQRPTVSLEEIRAAIDERCSCDTAVNYGKYRSCVATLINSLRAFSLIDAATKEAIKADNAVCKAEIQARKKENKGNKGNKGNNG